MFHAALSAVEGWCNPALDLGFWLGSASMGLALRLPFIAVGAAGATLTTPVHILTWRGFIYGYGVTKFAGSSVLVTLACGLHTGSAADFWKRGSKPWDVATPWELLA